MAVGWTVAATGGEILACGAVIHNLPPPCSAGPLRSVMNNCQNDISGDCPAKHLVWSNLKIGTTRLVHTGLKRQPPWRGPRMLRCMIGSRNTQRQTQRRDGDCGLGRYHASSFGPTSSLRQNQGCFRDSRRYRLQQTPNAEPMFLPFSTSPEGFLGQRPLFERTEIVAIRSGLRKRR